MNRIVSVTKRVKSNRGLRYCPVVVSGNGRIKPDAVVVDGKEERHPEELPQLVCREAAHAGLRGQDAATATARRQQKEAEVNARNNGIAVVPESSRRLVSVAVAGYLEDTELTKKPKTLAAYATALNYFVESRKKARNSTSKTRPPQMLGLLA